MDKPRTSYPGRNPATGPLGILAFGIGDIVAAIGDPGVRVNQWVQAVGGVTGSVCDASYAGTLGSFAAAIAQQL